MSSTYLGSAEAASELAAQHLRTTVAVRERAGQLLTRARHGESSWFAVEDGRIESTAQEIVTTIRRRFRKLRIPLHSCWRHLEAGGVDRGAQLQKLLSPLAQPTRAHALVELATVSVLLGGAAGHDWKYTEPATAKTFTGSEGLAVASYHAFLGGLFSSDASQPLQVDAKGLRALVADHLAAAFQVSEDNPLPGLDERLILLRRLGEVMQQRPQVFGADGRPGGLFDMLVVPFGGTVVAPTSRVAAHGILSQILYSLSDIWPSGNAIGAMALGDCWRHPAVQGEGLSAGWMPLHEASQRLTYSLIEPFEWSGVRVHSLDGLTALPDAANCGLLLDTGLLRLKDEAAAQELWQPGDEVIVEWRALTVALMDEVATAVQDQLRVSASELPLACVLEGGSRAAGGELARQRRGGLPPLKVTGDEGLVVSSGV